MYFHRDFHRVIIMVLKCFNWQIVFILRCPKLPIVQSACNVLPVVELAFKTIVTRLFFVFLIALALRNPPEVFRYGISALFNL